MLNGLIRYKQILLLPLAVIVVFGVPALAASVLAFDDVELPQIGVDFKIYPSSPVAKNEPIIVSPVYTDPSSTVAHFAILEWGDGSQCDTRSSDPDDCMLTEPSPGSSEPEGTVIGHHIYNDPGVYTVLLKVTRVDESASGEASSPPIVVYDPEGGFVTGGGWINSPAGACNFGPCTDDTIGKATFGFVSKYKKGQSTPSGNTEFQFKAGDLNFHSEAYDWLVVNQNGTNAQFKGDGTINGSVAPDGNNYSFMVWATDDNPDTFRIKIWYGENSTVYDNGPDQPIGGGSIIIHKAK